MEEAMRRCQEKFDFVIRWRPFLLRPNVPPEGIPRVPGMGPPKHAMERVAMVGQTVGLNFTFSVGRTPNTLAAHALLDYAGNVDGGRKQDALQEAIFKAFFTDGIYPDATNLSKIAKDLGFDEQTVYKVMTDQNNLEKAAVEANHWRGKGVSGVPFYFMNGQATFSGAQDPDAFVHMFETIAKKFPHTAPEQSLELQK